MLVLILVPWWCGLLWSAEGVVLDPALYLLPSPPLVPASHNNINQWSQPRIEREADQLAVLPIEQTQTTLEPHSAASTSTPSTSEIMEKSETFWPSLRSTSQYFGSIHVPLAFSLSGTYGGYGGLSKGIIGSSYGSVSDVVGVYGKSGLAGTSYGSYTGYPGTRIYGGAGGPSWSGWGNGKWGHYGKG